MQGKYQKAQGCKKKEGSKQTYVHAEDLTLPLKKEPIFCSGAKHFGGGAGLSCFSLSPSGTLISTLISCRRYPVKRDPGIHQFFALAQNTLAVVAPG
ncbi:MAG: hypothetical protein WC732_07675 [Candidatus Omnitrophota bacterium]